jgi:hypothetical protein
MRNISNKAVETIKTHFKYNKFLFFPENRSHFETTWKNMVASDRQQMEI